MKKRKENTCSRIKKRMKIISALTAAVMLAAAVPQTAAAESVHDDGITGKYDISEYTGNKVVVMYRNGDIDLKTYDSQESLREGLVQLASDESVEIFQPSFTYENQSVKAEAITKDSYSKVQWALKNNGSFKGYRSAVNSQSGVDVNAQAAWEAYSPQRDVIVAVVDTGIDINHTELKDSIWKNPGEIPGNGIDDDKNGYTDDVNGWNFYKNNASVYNGSEDTHGTHCAGTIGAKANNMLGIAGLADYDNIKIMPVKALGGAGGKGDTYSIAESIKYAEANGAKICSLSLGTDSDDDILYRTIKNSKMLFIVAAGNNSASGRGANIDNIKLYPAAYDFDNIISVANIKADGTLNISSGYGVKSVDLGAPGTDIVSTDTAGQYAYMTGTSMAVPFVSAAAALVYTANSSLDISQVKQIIMNTAKPLQALKGKTVTGGMLDCGAAVKYASGKNDSDSIQSGQDGTSDNGNSENGSSGENENTSESSDAYSISIIMYDRWRIALEIPGYLRLII